MRFRARSLTALGLVSASVLATAACGAAVPPTGVSGAGKPGNVVQVVAAENFWGSIAAQIGGIHAHVVSVITNPNTDPHQYEPTASDARNLASAQLVIENGIGYDPWVSKFLAADASTAPVLDVGGLLGVASGGNPHRWYNPANVQTVIDALVAHYQKLDPADRAYFSAQRTSFNAVALSQYNQLISSIKSTYGGTPVGASESIFSMLAPALGLNLITPPAFLTAISEGTDVSAADKATIDNQIQNHLIKIYVYNSQNTTPDVQAQLDECRAAGIPTARITETLQPAGATYQAWQTAQLREIQAALAKAARR
jgi:zinc/manganese transport system substrate-binding protein